MIVLDTNVVSELMRTRPERAVVDWVRAHPATELFTTAVTLAEILYGIARLPDGRRKTVLTETAAEVFGRFATQVLAFDVVAARHYARIVDDRDRHGSPIDGFDAQIASICRANQAVLATRDVKDFADTGVTVVDPWRP